MYQLRGNSDYSASGKQLRRSWETYAGVYDCRGTRNQRYGGNIRRGGGRVNYRKECQLALDG